MNLFAFSGLSVAVACGLLVALLLLFGRGTVPRVLALFNAAVAAWGIGLFLAGVSQSGEAALAAWKIANFGGVFVAPAFYHFATVFCGLDRRMLLRVGYVQAAFFLVLLAATDIAFERTREVFGLHYLDPSPPYLLAVAFYLFFVLASYYEFLRFLPTARGHKKTQTLYVIFGFLFGFTGATYTFLPMYGIGPFYPWGNLGITFYCVVLGYAILRHRVMDVRVALRKGLVYTLSVALITGLLVVLVGLLSTRAGELTGLSSRSVVVLAALVLALVFTPLKRQIQSLLDRIFNRVGYDAPAVIRGLGRGLLSTIDFGEVCRLIVSTAAGTLAVRSGVLFAATETGFERVCSVEAPGVAPDPRDVPNPPLFPDAPLIALARFRGVLLRDDLLEIDLGETARAAAAALDSLGGWAAVPIVIDDRPEYLLVLGEKLRGEAFSAEDVSLLDALSSQGALALRNASLHRDLATAFGSLQAEVVERRRVEEALRRAAGEWRATFDSTSEAIVMVDQYRCIMRANLASAALFGTDLRELIGRNLPGLFSSLVEAGGADLLPRARLPGERAETEVFAAGTKRWLHVACDTVPSGAHWPGGGAVYTLRDVTELKAMQTSMLEAKRDWEECFDTINEAITLHDTDFNIVRANKAAASLLGLPLESITGQKCHVPYHGSSCPPRGCPSCSVLSTGEAVVQEVFEPHLGKHLEIKSLPRLSKSGEVDGLIHVVRDISAQKRAERSREALAAELEQRVQERTEELTAANQELDSFAYAVSHDLRAPLRAVVGFSQTVLEEAGGELTAESRDNLERVVHGGMRMNSLIDGLLDLSRCARSRLQHTRVDISTLAGGCLEDLARQEPERNITWRVEPGLLATGDARMIDALLRNLIGNAWKYTAHTPRPEILVRGVELDGARAYCVADNGAGFDMAQADMLFQPFQRLHRQEEFEGIGIGLATSLRIVRRHGGRIVAEGRPGRGATFCFTLAASGSAPEPS